MADPIQFNDDERKLYGSLVGQNGSLLGGLVTLPKEVAVAASPLLARVVLLISREGGKYAGMATEAILKPIVRNDEKAAAVATVVEKGFGYVFPFFQEAIGVGRAVHGYFAATAAVKQEMASLLAVSNKGKTGMGAYFGSHNEIVNYMQGYIRKKTQQAVLATSTGLIERAPQMISLNMASQHDAMTAGSEEAKALAGRLNTMENLVTPGAGVVNALISETVIKRKETEGEKPAWLLVKELVDTVTGYQDAGKLGNPQHFQRIHHQIQMQVVAIFNRHQENMGRKAVPERCKDEFDQACDTIARRIATGELDPMAVAVLAGEGKVVLKGGKNIVSTEALNEELDKISVLFAQRNPVNVSELLAEAPFDKAQLAEAFKALDDKGHKREKAMLAALFEDALLKEAGLKEPEIAALRKEMHAGLMEEVGQAAYTLAQHDVIALKEKFGLSAKEIQGLQKFAAQVDQYGEQIFDIALRGKSGAEIKTAVRNSVVATEAGRDFWVNRVAPQKEFSPDLSLLDPAHGGVRQRPVSAQELAEMPNYPGMPGMSGMMPGMEGLTNVETQLGGVQSAFGPRGVGHNMDQNVLQQLGMGVSGQGRFA